MFPDNKAVQPCLARQADIRRTISFNSPSALTKFAEHKKTAQSNEQYDWLQRAVCQEPLTGHPGHDRAATHVSKP